MSRIASAFERAKRENRAAFIPYLTAGYPDEAGFLKVAQDLLEVADLLEVGLPYSDPLGDGPTIQRSSEEALRQGVSTAKVFELIARLRRQSDKPLVLMTYYNPIYCYPSGEAGFLQDLKAAGGDGVILPDLPADEADTLISAARELGIDTIFLVAPTSTDERLRVVTSACSGFIYAVSVTGVTGARDQLPQDVPDLVRRVKAVSSVPVAVGFGVSGKETARPVAEVADGVVVGSALIRAIAEQRDLTPLAEEIAQACRKTLM
ncbi:MAG: tryptophan synthase subunit alpha [Trueperaceae bacterium]|nr:MAG: tryptophan synthase subunit alpha [Trueperaceae bacterium]